MQTALGGGYLSAFPTEHFERLQALKPVWAPFYVVSPALHKVVMHLDLHPLPARSYHSEHSFIEGACTSL